LHVVHGVLSLDVGGLERVVVALTREGGKRGQRVTVVCVEKPGALADAARDAGAEVLSLDKPPGRRAEFVGKATELLDRLQPDAVHTHQIGAAWYLGPGTNERRVPLVHTEHGNQFARESGVIQVLKARLLYRQTAKRIARFCCVSAEIAAAVTRWRTVPKGIVEVVPNGITVDPPPGMPSREQVRESLGIPETAKVVGTVGRLTEVKRQDRLLRAVATLPDVWLLVVGDGDERANLERLAAELGVAKRTRFAGYQPQPEAYLRAMDAFALTSRSEGFPVSLLEAWAAGMPVVSTAVGGIPDVVTDGTDGLLVRDGDGPELGEAIRRVLTDPALAERLTRNGATTVRERYSLERVAAGYEARYRGKVVGTLRVPSSDFGTRSVPTTLRGGG
jgi:glycosyltransferase involved in cell wall biosynthesis